MFLRKNTQKTNQLSVIVGSGKLNMFETAFVCLADFCMLVCSKITCKQTFHSLLLLSIVARCQVDQLKGNNLFALLNDFAVFVERDRTYQDLQLVNYCMQTTTWWCFQGWVCTPAASLMFFIG